MLIKKSILGYLIKFSHNIYYPEVSDVPKIQINQN